MTIRDANPWGKKEASLSRKDKDGDDNLAFFIEVFDPFQVNPDNILAFIAIYRLNQKQKF